MREGTTGATSGGVGARHGDRIGVDSGGPTSPSGSSLPATSDGTREGLESLQGGVCLTRGMKVLLRVGQSEWGWGTPPRGRGAVPSWSGGCCLSPSLGPSPSPGPRGGAAPRKPVSEMPMEKDRGVAHSLEPGKENTAGRNQGSSLLSSLASSALGPQLP